MKKRIQERIRNLAQVRTEKGIKIAFRKIHQEKRPRVDRMIQRDKNAIKAMFKGFEGKVDEYIKEGYGRGLEAFDVYTLFGDFSAMISKYLPRIVLAVKAGFREGANKVRDRKGKKLKLPKVKDEKAINALVNKQVLKITNLHTDAVEEVRAILLDGLDRGLSIQNIKKEIKKRVPDLVDYRAARIARTEIVNAHSEGIMQTFKENGIRRYTWISAKDRRRCPYCEYLHGKSFDVNGPTIEQWPRSIEELKSWVKQGYSLHPVKNTHPNDRCVEVADV